MGGGAGRGLDFGATFGSGRLPLGHQIAEPENIPGEGFVIGRSLGAAALNYDVKDPKSGKSYKFLEGSSIRDVQVFAGRGVRNKLKPEVSQGLCQQVGGRPRDWKHVKGIGTIDVNGHPADAEVHWFEAAGQPKVKFKVKRWL